MERRVVTASLVWFSLISFLAVAAYGQSLTDKLEEEDSFYENYGKEPYAKLKMEKDVIGHYDQFGEHIVDGVNLYRLENTNAQFSDAETDSVVFSASNEYQKNDFYEKFSNLVVTQDAIGGVKTSFLVGDQITTKFTPLTFNKTNFKGIRWDWWSSGLKFTALLTRTRPGWTATMKDDGTGNALVEYPISRESFPKDYYSRGIRGDKDFSNKSPYGDYDFMWALHAENRIANAVDVGLTLINHHSNDVKKGPTVFSGNLPDSLMPEYIHFEFYDLTAADTLDAGVFVESVEMYVNGTGAGNRCVPAPAYRDAFRRAFTADRDRVLLPRSIPLARPQNGPAPVIVEFAVDPIHWRFADGRQLSDMRQVKRVYFKYVVAGNYTVFVSTDRQIPLSIYGTYDPIRNEVDYSHPTRSVGDIYDAGVPVDYAPPAAVASDEDKYSTTYFGEYIAQSPKKISVSATQFANAAEQSNISGGWPGNATVVYNRRQYDYEFNLNASAFTIGANFRGELLGVKFSGEVAYNGANDMLPGREDSRERTNKFAGLLRAERPIGKQFGINGEVYYLSPEWKTSMNNLAASQYFSQTDYKGADSGSLPVYDYQVHPRPLDRSWQNIDDNDDNDGFVDWEPRRYPSDLNADSERKKFYNDGTLKPGVKGTYGGYEMEYVQLPSRLYTPYDDPDGVVASKSDRNLNGQPDYQEDFLLFSSDPPEFELGMDLNNNGIPDYEDDDILPDFFSEVGRSVGAVVTGDEVRTLGIQGFNLNLRWTPLEGTPVDAGVIWESVVDRDFIIEDNTSDLESGEEALDGKSRVFYLTAKRQVLRRSQGLQYEFGNEIRYVQDAIRNDVIMSTISRVGEEIDPRYWYRIDPLAYRNALVDNLVGSVTYTNIRNFEYGARARVGVEYHIGLEEAVYSPEETPLFDDDYTREWERYQDRIVMEGHALNRVSYRIGFNTEFEGWRSFLNFLNRLEIVPQYKLQFSLRKELSGPDETSVDPRNLARNMAVDANGDGVYEEELDGIPEDYVQALRDEWYQYEWNNQGYLMNVPILRLDYKIAENTKLQVGYQWKRFYDLISPEQNHAKNTFLAQIVSKAQWKGYSVTLLLGGKYSHVNFDNNQRDPVTNKGWEYDIGEYQFFAKLFSGN